MTFVFATISDVAWVPRAVLSIAFSLPCHLCCGLDRLDRLHTVSANGIALLEIFDDVCNRILIQESLGIVVQQSLLGWAFLQHGRQRQVNPHPPSLSSVWEQWVSFGGVHSLRYQAKHSNRPKEKDGIVELA